MSDSGESAPAGVVYRSPFGQRFFTAVKAFFVWLVMTTFVAAFYWAGLFMMLGPNVPPWWAHVPGGVLVLGIPLLLAWLSNRSEPTRLTLYDDRLRIGGRLFGRNLSYEQLHLVKLEKPERTVGKLVKLLIERRPGKAVGIWLRRAEAEECFDAIRSMSEHVPAIGLDQTIYTPVNPEFADRGRRVLALEFHRKARRSLFGGIAMCAAASFIFLMLILGGPTVRIHPKSWFLAVGLPMAGVGSIIASTRFRQQALSLESGKDAAPVPETLEEMTD